MIAKPLRLGFLLLLGLGILAALAAAEPITGPEFDLLLEVQNIPLQRELERIFPESEGYLVTGPLEPMAALSEDADASPYGRLLVVCPNLEAQARAERQAAGITPCYYAATIHQLRWLIWARQAVSGAGPDTNAFLEYSVALWHYLHDLDLGDKGAVAPLATAYGLPAAVRPGEQLHALLRPTGPIGLVLNEVLAFKGEKVHWEADASQFLLCVPGESGEGRVAEHDPPIRVERAEGL